MNLQADLINQVIRTLDRYQQDSERWQENTRAYFEGLFTNMHVQVVQEVTQRLLIEMRPLLTETARTVLVEVLEAEGYLQPMKMLVEAHGQYRTDEAMLGHGANVLTEDVVEVQPLTAIELIFYRNEKQEAPHKLSDLQLCAKLGFVQNASGQRRVRRLRERMRREGKL